MCKESVKDTMAEKSTLRGESPAIAATGNEASNTATLSSPPSNTCEAKTGTSSSTSIESDGTTAYSSGSEPDMTLSEESEVVLRQLARQVEYYFSTANLSKDTYVETLRSLNDGYAPVSIIANFGKVRSLVPYDAINAVQKAATEYSDLLEVVMIDAQTGKKVTSAEEEGRPEGKVNTIVAVGPISGKPIPVSETMASLPIPAIAQASPAAPTPAPVVQNTVILREVPSSVDEEQVRELFTFEKCPPVQSVRLDVANCWFVTLDTSSRDDMLQVMFQLRGKKFASGEPVLARLKSSVVVTTEAPSIPNSLSSQTMPYLQMQAPPSPGSRYMNNNGGRKNKKKNVGPAKNKNISNNKVKPITTPTTTSPATTTSKNNRRTNNSNNNGKNKKSSGHDRSQQQQRRSTSPSGDNMVIGSRGKDQAVAVPATLLPRVENPPPSLGDEQFPALPSDDLAEPSPTKKIEVETVPQDRPEDDFDKNRGGSDGASTATTSTSSSTSKPMAMGGYAAALLKAAPPKPQTSSNEETTTTNNCRHAVKGGVTERRPEKKNTTPKKKVTETANDSNIHSKSSYAPAMTVVENVTRVVVTPPSWGGGRSFADVLKKESAAAATVATQLA